MSPFRLALLRMISMNDGVMLNLEVLYDGTIRSKNACGMTVANSDVRPAGVCESGVTLATGARGGALSLGDSRNICLSDILIEGPAR